MTGRCLLLSLLLHLSILALGRGFFSGARFPLTGGGGIDVQIEGSSFRASAVGNNENASPSHRERTNSPPQVKGEGSGTGAEGGGSGMEGTDPLLATIRSQIEGARSYPLLAERMGIEGVVSLRFEILQDGRPTSITLLQSSGSKLLDDAALSTIEKGAPYPFYQKPISLSVHYRKRTS
ncbi:MAG: energy transducer TonB [Deltaproteobacteria bacterium]|nr:energy transducer TonB [Deltaproteobacteria bacterium]